MRLGVNEVEHPEGVEMSIDAQNIEEVNSPVPASSGGSASRNNDPVNQPDRGKKVRVGRAPPESAINEAHTTALEKSIKNYVQRRTGTVINPEKGMSFDSLSEAYDFYNLFSWENGFGVRYAKGRLNMNRVKCMQEIACACSGKPHKNNSRSSQCLYPALIRLLRSKDNRWYIA